MVLASTESRDWPEVNGSRSPQQPLSPNGRSIGPRTMAAGGIQDLLAQMGARVRITEAARAAEEEMEHGGWKRLGMSLGHFADIVSQNERAGCFTVGMLWLDAHPEFNTPETTRSGSLGGMPIAVATGRALDRMRLDTKLDPPMRDERGRPRSRSAALFAQLDRLHRETDRLYIRMDMDVLDPREVMGHGSKVANGPSSEELAALFKEFVRRR